MREEYALFYIMFFALESSAFPYGTPNMKHQESLSTKMLFLP